MEPVTSEEAQEMREVLEKFFGPLVQSWEITPEMYAVLGKLITESGKCTRAMHLVPRPWDFSHPLKWAVRQVRQAVVRYLKTPEGQHYIVCMRATALHMRTEFEMVGRGL